MIKRITKKIFNKDLGFKINWPIMLPVFLLCLFSLILLRSFNPELFYKQAIWLCIGFFAMLFIQFIRLRVFNEYAYHLYGLLIILLSITHFMPKINHAKRWIITPFFQFQPSEIGKIILILALAKFLSDRKDNNNQLLTVVITLVIVSIPASLVLFQPDLGTSIIYGLISLPMLYWSGIRPYYLFLFIAPLVTMLTSYSITVFYIWMAVIIIVLFLSQPTIRQGSIVFTINICFGLLSSPVYGVLKPYQRERLLAVLDPYKYHDSSGYQLIQSLIAIGSGGISGKGFMKGTQTHGSYLPVKESDFVVSVAGEEFGLLGIGYILIIFSIFIYWVTEYMGKMNNDFSSLTLVGILSTLFSHLILNMGITVGLFPVTGLPATFLSYGGTFLITCLIMVGIINNNITNNI